MTELAKYALRTEDLALMVRHESAREHEDESWSLHVWYSCRLCNGVLTTDLNMRAGHEPDCPVFLVGTPA